MAADVLGFSPLTFEAEVIRVNRAGRSKFVFSKPTRKLWLPLLATRKLWLPLLATRKLWLPLLATRKLWLPLLATRKLWLPLLATRKLWLPLLATRKLWLPLLATRKGDFPSVSFTIWRCIDIVMALISLRSRSHVKASMVLTRADHLFIQLFKITPKYYFKIIVMVWTGLDLLRRCLPL